MPIAPQLLPLFNYYGFNPDMMPQPGSVAAGNFIPIIGARFDDPLYMEMFNLTVSMVDNTKPQLNDDTTINLNWQCRFWTACVCWPMNDNAGQMANRIDYQSRMYGFKYDALGNITYMSGIKMGKFKPKMRNSIQRMSLNNPYGNPIMRMMGVWLEREQWGMVDSTHEINNQYSMSSLSGMPDQSVDNWMSEEGLMKDIMFDNLQAFIPLLSTQMLFSDSPMEDGRRKNRLGTPFMPKSSLDYSILAALDPDFELGFNLCFDNIANSRKMSNMASQSNPTPVNREYGGLTFITRPDLGLAAQRVTNPYMGFNHMMAAYNVNDELSGWNDRIRLTLGAVPSVADYFDRRLSDAKPTTPGYDPNTDYDNSYQNPNNIDSAIFN
ncbi:phage virion structural protein [Salmonella phage SPFM7]|nr:phage virion structural protein [Salmonella phage SPFM7]